MIQCGRYDDARVGQAYCFQNSMGQYCVLIDTSSLPGACNYSKCSQECKDLLISTRAQVGCCIPSFFNNSEIFDHDSRAPYDYSLWSSCGVEPVTQKCPPGPIIIHPIPIDPTCTEAVADARVQSIACRKQLVEDIRNKLAATQGCENYKYPGGGECNANVRGVYCKTLQGLGSNYTAASNSCHDTSTCDPLCIQTLNNIINTAGCCFMDQYNATSDATEKWLKYEFWSRCDLKSTGYCKEFLNGL